MKTKKHFFKCFILEKLAEFFRFFGDISLIITTLEILWGFPTNNAASDFTLGEIAPVVLVAYSLSGLAKLTIIKLKKDSTEGLS